MARVLLSIPNGDAWVHKRVMFAAVGMLSDRRHHVTLIAPTHRPYENNLHLIQRDFLKGEFDYWMSMDDDNPPIRNPLDLIALDKDVIGFPTPVWHSKVLGDRPYYFNAMYDRGEDGFEPLPSDQWEGLREVDAVGSGCFLIARRVMENMKAPFLRTWTEDGVVDVGGDFSFCRRAKAAGFRIWTHFGYPCQHFNELCLNEAIEFFGEMRG